MSSFSTADPPLLKTTTPSPQRTTAVTWVKDDDAPAPITRTDTVKMQTEESKIPFGKSSKKFVISYKFRNNKKKTP